MTETTNVIRSIAKSMLGAVESILTLFNDDVTFKLVAGDFGLDPNITVPRDKMSDVRNSLAAVQTHQFIDNNQETLADIAEALSKIEDLLSSLEALIDAIQDRDDPRVVSEYLYLLLQMATAQTVRKDAPALYSAALFSLSALDAKESLPALATIAFIPLFCQSSF